MLKKVLIAIAVLAVLGFGIAYNIKHKDEIAAHNKFCKENTSAPECKGWKDPDAYSDASGDGGH